MPLDLAYKTPAKPSAPQPASTAARKLPSDFVIGPILAFVLSTAILLPTTLRSQEPPPNLVKLVAARESETEKERNEYTYRQTLTIQELDSRGSAVGQYKEVRDVIFSPTHERTDQMIGKPVDGLKSLKLTPEDFADLRDIQPLVLTEEQLPNYETKFRGDEVVDDIDCWVLQVRPRQILSGQRFFDGMIWADKKDYNIIRMQGQAVPQIHSMTQENLFPRFTTVRKPVDGKHWFAYVTYADDTLQFRNGPLRERLKMEYTDYKRFGATSTFIVK